MALRWGIVSAGKISHDFVNGVHTHSSEDHQVAAIAARSKVDATTFAQTNNIPKIYEGYEELAKDMDIDVVYIGTINTQHLKVAKLMLDHGKHVLCEKPLTMNRAETKELINYAKEKNLFLMEGIWSRFFPAYHKLRDLLDQGVIGEVLQISVDFGFPLEHIERVAVKEVGGSAVLDIGVYVLQLSQFVYKGLKPISVVSSGNINKYGTDNVAAGILTYSGGRTSVVSCNTRVELDNTAYIYGTKGMIKIPEFWCPISITTPQETLEFPLPPSDAKYNFLHSAGFAYEAEEVRQCINKGLIESPIVTHENSLELAELMDTFRKNAAVS